MIRHKAKLSRTVWEATLRKPAASDTLRAQLKGTSSELSWKSVEKTTAAPRKEPLAPG